MSKQKITIKNVADFTPTGQATAGVSPSFQAVLKPNEERFQIKRSNSIRTHRKMMGYDPDSSDILGEYIASQIIHALVNTNPPPELAPEVSLLYDSTLNNFSLSSKYLNDSVSDRNQYSGMTFGDLIKARGGERKRDKPTIVFNEDPNINQLPVGKPFDVSIKGKTHNITLNKHELYKATVASMCVADHDLNPDNFFVVVDTENDKAHIGKIDPGHAFNDLIKKWLLGGHRPNIQKGRGCILDMINRDKVNGGKSKFSRDFGNGMTLDRDFAKALRAEQNDISHALEKCKAELLQLVNTNEQVKKAVMDSAKTLNKRMDVSLDNKTILKKIAALVKKVINAIATLCDKMGKPLANKDKLTEQEAIEKLIENCDSFVKENQKEAKSVANLIDIQAMTEDIMQKDVITKADMMEFTNKVKEIYKEDQRYLKQKSFKDPIEWARTDQNSKPFKGTLYEYIQHRAKLHGVSKSRLNDLSTELKKAEIILNNPELTKHITRAPIANIKHIRTRTRTQHSKHFNNTRRSKL